MNKLAGTPDSSFEQSFFQLAYQQLQDKLGNLLPFLVGFELVQKSDDGDKALGVFGFRSNNGQILYVPVFFINGTVKGLDLLYSKNHQQFYPLNEDFADMFMHDDVSSIGSASSENKNDVAKDSPNQDMRDLVRPPQTGKYTFASDQSEELSKDAAYKEVFDGTDLITLFKTASTFDFEKYESGDGVLLKYLKIAGGKTKQAFMSLLEKNAAYTEAVLDLYPMEKIAAALAADNLPGKKFRSKSDLEVVTPANAKEKGLTPDQKNSLLTKGYVILDKREDEHKSKFGVTQFIEKFVTPQESGFYPYITANGGIRFGLVLLKPLQLQQHLATDDAIVVDIEAESMGQAYLVDNKNIFVKDAIKIKDYSELHKKMQDVSELTPSFDATYILIDENLKCSTPFSVLSNMKDPSGLRRIKVELYRETHKEHNYHNPTPAEYTYGKDDRPGSAHALPRGNYYEHPKKKQCMTLVVTKKVGNDLTIKGDIVYLPAGFKVLKLDFRDPTYSKSFKVEGDYTEAKSDEARYKREEAMEAWKAGRPGSKSALVGTLYEKNVFPLTMRNNGSEYYTSVASFKKHYANADKAKIGMVLDFGLDVKQAEDLVDSIKNSRPVKGYIKMAYTGDDVPFYHDEAPWNNEMGNPTTSGVPMTFEQPIGEQYTDDPSQLGRGAMGDPHGVEADQDQNEAHKEPGSVQGDVNSAVQMAQGGQKEIFDTQSIATLAKYVSPDNKINEYMPYLIAAMDRLGRMLFLVHWESDKFAEMYGRSDMPELVELLTSVFKNLGDLVIFMKRKSPQISINMNQEDNLDG